MGIAISRNLVLLGYSHDGGNLGFEDIAIYFKRFYA